MTRILRRVRSQGSKNKVDPYWDFTHTPGDGYDFDAIRPLLVECIVSSNDKRTVQADISLLRAPNYEDEFKQAFSVHGSLVKMEEAFDSLVEAMIRLDPREFVYKVVERDEGSSLSYESISSASIDVPHPGVTLALDVSALHPGKYFLEVDFLGAEQMDPKLEFVILRRPFYTFHHPVDGYSSKAPLTVAPSLTQQKLPWSGVLADQTVHALVFLWETASAAEIGFAAAGKKGFDLGVALTLTPFVEAFAPADPGTGEHCAT